MDVTSVDIDRRDSFAHLVPSGTYVKAWYKLKELEVALCSSCLTSDQVHQYNYDKGSRMWFSCGSIYCLECYWRGCNGDLEQAVVTRTMFL